jgi:uncharacterized protein involved in exopolysaccharide biosynthesis
MGAVATGAGTISVDEFQALEQKVLRAVELIKKEREARAAAEAELASAKAEIADLQSKLTTAGAAQTEVETLTREREAVRQRVEKMLAQMDELL